MKSRKGFTLTEIMIVVSVIGLLAAAAIPSFNLARSKAILKAQKENVRVLNHAIEMWAMDNLVGETSPIGASVTNYIKGGFATLRVGPLPLNITNITKRTVDHTFTVADLY